MRVRFQERLDTARIAMQLDVGFGDVVVPLDEPMEYPTILGFPAPQLRGYRKESSIAEKFEAMVRLGVLNSRMKDFFDIWLLSQQFDFDGQTLATAITKTFSRRGICISPQPVALTGAFTADPSKAAQWRGFIRKNRLVNIPQELGEVVSAVAVFLGPISKASSLKPGERRKQRSKPNSRNSPLCMKLLAEAFAHI